jgi:hypothetical protein
MVFDAAELRDAHLRARPPCEVGAGPQLLGISDAQRSALNQSMSRGKSIPAQWNDMWFIIFPGEAPPSSVYLGDYAEEMIARLRRHWNCRSSEIIQSVLHKEDDPVATLDRTMLDRIMSALFDHLVTEYSYDVAVDAEPSTRTTTPTMEPTSPPAISSENICQCFIGTDIMDISSQHLCWQDPVSLPHNFELSFLAVTPVSSDGVWSLEQLLPNPASPELLTL